MKTVRQARLVEGSVGKILVKLTIPMVFGIVGIVAFNLVDTFFVGRLGTDELAALSFTFPVVLIINSLAHGLGIGASAVISRAIGEGNHNEVQRLTTDSLVLSVLLVTIFVVIGQLTIDPIFRLLGATPEILSLIKQYMRIWYFGMIFVIVPMVGNNAIRATGDTKTPAAIMIVAVICNFALDPLLIFGIGPFPRLELAGAAIATVIARATTFFVSLIILHFRERMIAFIIPSFKTVMNSWKRILYIGLPNAGTRIIMPLTIGIITRIVASYGKEAIAGYGVSLRIEFFSLTVIMALCSVIAPFVGQNWGAGRYDRLRLGNKLSERFSMGWGLLMYIILAAAARPIASLFNDNPEVISTIVLYLRVVPIGYGLQGILLLSTASMNVLNKPLHAAALTVLQMFALYIPLAFVGSYLIGLPGVFAALALVYCTAGTASHFVLGKIMAVEEMLRCNEIIFKESETGI
ncbi:MAG: MATE family efflux transporter [Candidatus Cloacimonadota bacterium]|nr:MAG: MATE family efflux transporter [Candidatus Cloacimonadota bacterium]